MTTEHTPSDRTGTDPTGTNSTGTNSTGTDPTGTDPVRGAGDPRRFLRAGRLESMPRRWRDKVAVTRYLAVQALPTLLEPVTERELTERLRELAHDPVGVRRALVDHGLVRRTRDGAEYWRTERTEYDD